MYTSYLVHIIRQTPYGFTVRFTLYAVQCTQYTANNIRRKQNVFTPLFLADRPFEIISIAVSRSLAQVLAGSRSFSQFSYSS